MPVSQPLAMHPPLTEAHTKRPEQGIIGAVSSAPICPPHDSLMDRIAHTPALVRESIAIGSLVGADHREELISVRRWITTGIGASEGVARALALTLRNEHDRSAEFLPISHWLSPRRLSHADGLIVCSQGLCPNARMALQARGHTTRVLLTAADPQTLDTYLQNERWIVCPHGPSHESALLLRVSGPICAMASACAMMGALGTAPQDDWAQALARGLALGFEAAKTLTSSQLAQIRGLIALGDRCEALAGLAWAWTEGTLSTDHSVWDALGFVHGPFQALYGHDATLIALERASAMERAVFDRLASILPPRHTLLRIAFHGSPTEALFAHWGASYALLTTHAMHEEIDLCNWPGKGHDSAIYDVTVGTDL
ncbi:MAG: hypothetical protein Q8Q09_27205 [Deltaproteobacteria bacterium]|nr:hypothetical protein [Deltaproteobacteria bacterium]